MRFLITGEAGFIAVNLYKTLIDAGHEVVSVKDGNVVRLTSTGEMCVHRNSSETWAWHLQNLDIDVVIHNAATVGTDVVALNSAEATLTNVTGCYNISMACKAAAIPVCYIGTTVVYDTSKYQNQPITEASDKKPVTFYGCQKLAGENIISSHAKDWSIIRPLFAYGGIGDMNSLISKSAYAVLDGRTTLDMFLDPTKIKDYLHVIDFCNAVVIACEAGLWGEDYNVSAETPLRTLTILDMLSEIVSTSLVDIIKWYPQTDYLGNHMLSSKKFRDRTGWKPSISLREGIIDVFAAIAKNKDDYNPMIHLDRAEKEGIDLTQFFNSKL